MKQIFMILLLLFQHGCTLLPSQLAVLRGDQLSPRSDLNRKHRITEKQNKALKKRSKSEPIKLIGFKILNKDTPKAGKHHKHKLEDTATGMVAASFYPVDPQIFKVPRSGVGLSSFLMEHELEYAILATQAEIRRKVQAAEADEAKAVAAAAVAKTKAEKSKVEVLKNDAKNTKGVAEKASAVDNILELRPDIIALNRGPITTMFPRAFLGTPQVANLSVMPGDLIYTLEKYNALTAGGDFNQHYTVRGFAKRTGSFFTGKKAKKDPASVTELATDYSKEFAADAPAVVVVHRVYQGQLLQILVPNNAYGLFRRPQKPGKKNTVDNQVKRADLDQWKQYFETFSNIKIQDGDVIEFTTLDLLVPTLPLN